MLTGDKNETAKCIAISAGLKSKKQRIFEIKDCETTTDLQNYLDKLEHDIAKVMLIIDGTSLTTVLSTIATEVRFFDIAKNA